MWLRLFTAVLIINRGILSWADISIRTTKMRNIGSFLRNSRQLLNDNLSHLKEVSICIGNEAADADSIISSICYAYHKKRGSIVLNSSHEYIPIVNIDRKELCLRRDVEILLHKVNLSLSDLICIDEMASSCLFGLTSNQSSEVSSNPQVILLDHNTMSSKFKSLMDHLEINASSSVVEILDHHVDGNLYLESCSGDQRNIAFINGIATVGSTCTLVFEHIMKSESSSMKLTEEEDLSILLLGVIALDTYNMDPKAGKGTSRDQTALNHLNTIITRVNQNELFEQLLNAKTDPIFWNSLSSENSLILDFKDFSIDKSRIMQFGMSSLLLPIERYFDKENSIDAIESMLTDRDILVLMTLVVNSSTQTSREIAFFSKSQPRILSLIEFLASHDQSRLLDISPLKLPPVIAKEIDDRGISVAAFHQGNIKMSRKQVAPILSSYFELNQ